jgi:aminoglycoside 6'-N-acetyltransferase
MDAFKFKKLDYKDLPLLQRWYNSKHVQAWYAKGPLELEELESKFNKCMSYKSPQSIFGYIVYRDKEPIGYIQYYSIKRHQWLDIDLSQYLDNSAGIDIFIGEAQHLGKGLGGKIIRRFLTRHVFREYDFCFVDPQKDNLAALACYKKCGFFECENIFSDEKTPHLLLIKPKSSFKKFMHSKRDETKTYNTRNKQNLIGKYISDTYFYWRNKSKNHSAKTRNTT